MRDNLYMDSHRDDWSTIYIKNHSLIFSKLSLSHLQARCLVALPDVFAIWFQCPKNHSFGIIVLSSILHVWTSVISCPYRCRKHDRSRLPLWLGCIEEHRLSQIWGLISGWSLSSWSVIGSDKDINSWNTRQRIALVSCSYIWPCWQVQFPPPGERFL